MLACYDGQGAFYKPHMDSATTDPRRVTAIVYLVPPDWDAAADAHGGKLLWWQVRPDFAEEARPPAKREVAPKEGRLVLFRARTVKHEVLPTHRKRFAVTLWFFRAKAAGDERVKQQPWEVEAELVRSSTQGRTPAVSRGAAGHH